MKPIRRSTDVVSNFNEIDKINLKSSKFVTENDRWSRILASSLSFFSLKSAGRSFLGLKAFFGFFFVQFLNWGEFFLN